MLPVEIDQARCDGCGLCVKLCPTNVFELAGGKAVVARAEACIGCDYCAEECRPRAIAVHHPASQTSGEAVPSRSGSCPALASLPVDRQPGLVGAPLVPDVASRPAAPPPLPAAAAAGPSRVTVLASSKDTAPAAMNHKVLAAYPEICVGCQMCELACSLTHLGRLNPYEASIKVVKVHAEGQVFPVICHHCKIAKCEQVCPTKALYYDPKLRDVVMLDEGKCVRCLECVYACPFGAIQVGPAGQILKCDLCGGDPACVKVCQERPEFRPAHWTGGPVSCLQFLEPDQVPLLRQMNMMPRMGNG